MERQYDRLILLLKETREKIKELSEFFKRENKEPQELTKEEQKNLEQELLLFTIIVKEFRGG